MRRAAKRWRNSGCLAALAVLAVLAGDAAGQSRYRGFLSSTSVERYGLTKAWQTNVQLDRVRGQVAYMTLQVSSTDIHTIFQVVSGEDSTEFSERTLNAFNQPIGVDEAKRQAYRLRDVIRNDGKEASVVTRRIPATTIYAATTRGIVHAIDAETGRTRWTELIGGTRHPTLAPAANDEYVAVVNGSILYIVQAADGKPVWNKQLKGVPGAGPAVSDHMVHVPMIDGKMESYELSDPKVPVKYFQSIGRTTIQPVVTGNFYAWPSDRGHVYVGLANKGGSTYRLVAEDTIVAPVTYHNQTNALFIASIDGYVYCVHESSGDILWRFSTGETISHEAIPVGDTAYIITDKDNMFAVEIDLGLEKWSVDRVQRFLGASEKRVYCVDTNNRLVIFDAKTGTRIATMNEQLADMQMINWKTDRIYIGAKTGVLQCLHEADLKRPLVHLALGGVEKDKPQVKQGGDKPDDKPKDKGDDPFGGGDKGDDPFGTGGDKGGKSDPFGSDDDKDPFGS